MKRYNPKELEPKWQQVWANSDIYTAEDNSKKPKYYALSFFPYPSGIGLHIGHSRNFTITDVAARVKRQQGYNVLHPMGWDSFGLPGENYAIKTGVTPQITTKQNTDNFRAQCKKLGLSIDWSREFGSTDPSYYKWTQWFFLLLLERGLAYEKESAQWWCDECKTVLANEQVVNGCCWRHEDKPVSKKMLKQWFFKITDYADRLVEDLEDLDWPEGIKTMQRNWIGKSKGAEVEFRISNLEFRSLIMGQKDISVEDIEAIGGRVEKTTKEGYLCVAFPANKAKDFEELIVSKMQPGFWNEYIGNETVFIFKDKQGAVKRFVCSNETEPEILSLCELYANSKFDSIESMLSGNAWYHELFPNSKFQIPNSIKVFTTRPDTLFGATFMVLAPEHPLVAKITTPGQQKVVEQYVTQVSRKNEIERQEDAAKDKTGVFTGAYAINPVNNEQIPIWIADFVLAGYGTGAVFADACDERDFDFAKKYDIPLKPTVIPENDETEAKKVMNLEYSYTKEGILVNSGKYDGMKTSEARDKIVAELVEQGKAKEQVNYKIRDWLISRQRYWGAPIPVVHCPVDGTVAVPKDQLPLELPILEKFQPSGDGQSPLALATDWVNTTCPKCGGPAKRETDTMDGFACSSWYFLRFTDPHNNKEPFAQDKAKYWMPVDMYVGGAEHAVMHLLYARMWTKVMQDAGLIEFGEPFKALRNQGMLLAADGQKISKSKGNGISPEDIIEQGYGADALRMIVLFLAPFDMSTPWSNEGLAGVFRFLQRVWTISQKFIESEISKPNTEAEGELYKAAHTAIKKVSRDVELMGYNTAIAALMLYTNELYTIEKNYGFAARDAWQFALTTLTQLLAPFAPHITEELWADLGHERSLDLHKTSPRPELASDELKPIFSGGEVPVGTSTTEKSVIAGRNSSDEAGILRKSSSVHVAPWPVHDDAFLLEHVIKIAVQVNGKLRGEIEVPHDATKEVIEAEARAHENVASYITGDPKKVIYVPGKILNFVV